MWNKRWELKARGKMTSNWKCLMWGKIDNERHHDFYKILLIEKINATFKIFKHLLKWLKKGLLLQESRTISKLINFPFPPVCRILTKGPLMIFLCKRIFHELIEILPGRWWADWKGKFVAATREHCNRQNKGHINLLPAKECAVFFSVLVLVLVI